MKKKDDEATEFYKWFNQRGSSFNDELNELCKGKPVIIIAGVMAQHLIKNMRTAEFSKEVFLSFMDKQWDLVEQAEKDGE